MAGGQSLSSHMFTTMCLWNQKTSNGYQISDVNYSLLTVERLSGETLQPAKVIINKNNSLLFCLISYAFGIFNVVPCIPRL